MNKLSIRLPVIALSLFAVLLCANAVANDSVAPVGLDRDKIAGLGLTGMPRTHSRTSLSAVS